MAKHQILKPRALAIASGAAFYISGKPCKNGHVSERNIRGHCVECIKKANRRAPVMKSKRTAAGFVYVISATNGYVKVGKASDPYGRFTDHQCSSPLLLTLAYVCQCANPVDIEEVVHETLVAHRRHREWFEVTTELAIAAVRAAINATGAQTVESPHRSRKPGNGGASVMLRPAINEMAV